MASRKTPRRIGNTLDRWLKRQGLREQMRRYEIAVHWNDIVGPRVARRTEPRSLNEGTLVVAVSSSAWLNELSFLRAEIVKGVNRKLGAGTIGAVRLVVDRVQATTSHRTEATRSVGPSAKHRYQADLLAKRGVPALSDQQLRERILNARRAQLEWELELTDPDSS